MELPSAVRSCLLSPLETSELEDLCFASIAIWKVKESTEMMLWFEESVLRFKVIKFVFFCELNFCFSYLLVSV